MNMKPLSQMTIEEVLKHVKALKAVNKELASELTNVALMVMQNPLLAFDAETTMILIDLTEAICSTQSELENARKTLRTETEKAALAMQAKPHDATIVDSRARTEEKLDDTWFIETERASRKMCGTLFSQSIVARRAEVERMLDKAAGVDEVQPSVSLSV